MNQAFRMEEKMSGHSKYANIKHKKEKNDAAKGKIFTILGREIAVAVKEGGADPSNNSRLAQVIAKAQEQRKAGKQVLVARMNKNKKFQKEKLAAEGYTQIEESFNRD